MADDSPDRWSRLEALFEQALELAEADRAAFLLRETPDDPDLRAEVEALLTAQPDAEGFFADVARQLAPEALAPGSRVGPYRITGALGQGGMGVVYRAERADGQFEREVALKVLRAGDPRRFLSERRILARLDHPNIARLYGGGITPDGRPYFALELVNGLPITEYAARHQLDVEARLALFAQVCEAVQYAHRRLVVHRDIKPSNVMVTPEGTPMLLDFGVAKLVAETEDGLTLTGVAPLTPAYAAPEQVRGEAVTTATDVYALGVLLYELLTGRRPYRLADRARAAMERAILETEPTRPSAVVTEPAGEADTTTLPVPPPQLARRLAGDLDQIVLKALRKDPGDRYGSADALERDLSRHLEGLPIEARPASAAYRLRRFIRRHRAGVLASALGVLLLVGWAITATVQNQRVAAERDRAEALNDVLVGLFESPDPTTGGDRELTVSAFLASSTDRLQRDLADRPALQAELLSVVASSHLGLGDPIRADSVAALAAEAGRELAPGTHARTLARSWYAWTRTYQGDYETSEQIYRELLTEASVEDRPDVLNDFGIVLGEMGEAKEARRHLRAAIRQFRALVRRDPARRADLASALDNLASSFEAEQTPARLDSAWVLQQEAVAIKAEVYGADHPQVAEAMSELAGLAATRGEQATADSLYERSVSTLEPAYGSEHPTVATVLNNWALRRANAGDADGAEPLYRRALAIREAVYGRESESVAGTLQNLAALLTQVPGRETDALALFDRAEEIYASVMPEGHYLRAFPAAGRAGPLRALGRADEAVRDASRALAMLTEALGAEHGVTLSARGILGLALVDAGRPEEARPHLEASLGASLTDDERREAEAALAEIDA
ncbi:MAG: serine/threonine-protein kinase [Bacteroidota bacterium]